MDELIQIINNLPYEKRNNIYTALIKADTAPVAAKPNTHIRTQPNTCMQQTTTKNIFKPARKQRNCTRQPYVPEDARVFKYGLGLSTSVGFQRVRRVDFWWK